MIFFHIILHSAVLIHDFHMFITSIVYVTQETPPKPRYTAYKVSLTPFTKNKSAGSHFAPPQLQHGAWE